MDHDEERWPPLDWINAVWDYVHASDDRERAAVQRHQALLKVHETGWKNVSDTVRVGLAAIADAMRRQSR